MRALPLLALALLASCATVITPAALEAELPADQAARAIARWEGAVTLVNRFLDEEPLAELPVFRLALDAEGMSLLRPDGRHAFRVACTPWGWLVVKFGFTAQERSWGFVVGPQGDGPALLANTFLQGPFGLRSAVDLGGLILHEAVHTLEPSGTVGFWSGTRYYLLTVAHGGAREHPHEALAYAIEDRFRQWARDRPAERRVMR